MKATKELYLNNNMLFGNHLYEMFFGRKKKANTNGCFY